MKDLLQNLDARYRRTPSDIMWRQCLELFLLYEGTYTIRDGISQLFSLFWDNHLLNHSQCAEKGKTEVLGVPAAMS